MSEKILNRYAGTFRAGDAAKLPGEVLLDESTLTFVNAKGAQVVSFAINDIQKLKNTRHGNIAGTIDIELKTGEKYAFTLDRGLPAYDFINKHWTDRPVQHKSRADELRRLAELRGERIQKPQKLHEGRKRGFRIAALCLLAFTILLDTGLLATILNYILNGLCYFLRFLTPVRDAVADGMRWIIETPIAFVIINLVLIVGIFVCLSCSFKRRHPNR